jgi:flagellar hook protein FlgE
VFPAQVELSTQGKNIFVETAGSGASTFTSPELGGAGKIIPESLESSNTDFAEEFDQLILAQQIFQANARVVSTSNEILEALTSI